MEKESKTSYSVLQKAYEQHCTEASGSLHQFSIPALISSKQDKDLAV